MSMNIFHFSPLTLDYGQNTAFLKIVQQEEFIFIQSYYTKCLESIFWVFPLIAHYCSVTLVTHKRHTLRSEYGTTPISLYKVTVCWYLFMDENN